MIPLKLQKNEEERSHKSPRLLAIIGVLGFLAMLVLEVWVANHLATYGNKLSELEQTKAHLKLENQVLENSIAEKSSLKDLEQNAESLGFSSIKNLEFFKPADIASAF